MCGTLVHSISIRQIKFAKIPETKAMPKLNKNPSAQQRDFANHQADFFIAACYQLHPAYPVLYFFS